MGINTLLVVAAINAVLVATTPASVSGLREFYGSLMLWACAYPSWRYFHDNERRVPFLPAMTAFYFISYGLPAFHDGLHVRKYRPEPDLIEQTLLLALIGIVLLIAAFYLPRFRALPRFGLDLDLKEHAWKLIGAGYAFAIFRLPGIKVPLQLAELVSFMSFIPLLMLCSLLLLYLRGQLPRVLLIPVFILFLCLLAIDLATGFFAPPAFMLANILFVYVAEKGRVPVMVVVIVGVLLVPAMGVKREYRRILNERPEMNTSERVQLLGDLVGEVFSGQSRTTLSSANEVTQGRTDHLSAFAYVVARTPSSVPYWGGETYQTLLWSLVPRVLVPSKPKKTLGQEYGHRYKLLDRFDLITSINFEQTVEMYANFGLIGVLIGMTLLGLLYRIVFEMLSTSRGDGGTLIAASIFRILLNIESDFSLVFGSIVQQAILLYILLYVLAHKAQTEPEAATTS